MAASFICASPIMRRAGCFSTAGAAGARHGTRRQARCGSRRPIRAARRCRWRDTHVAIDAVARMGHGDITAHGFRSTFRDWAAKHTTFAREVAEMALEYAIPDAVEAAYQRGDLFDKRRKLMPGAPSAQGRRATATRSCRLAGHAVVKWSLTCIVSVPTSFVVAVRGGPAIAFRGLRWQPFGRRLS
jgi:hypothetical protein